MRIFNLQGLGAPDKSKKKKIKYAEIDFTSHHSFLRVRRDQFRQNCKKTHPSNHISFMWFFGSSISLLIFLIFGIRVHLFPGAANSELRKSLAMIVGFVFSIAVVIACCSALYIEDLGLILFLLIWLFVTISNPIL
jgi:uncharacterized protein with PQ loop repeat